MQFTVGGDEYDLTKQRVLVAMRGVRGEPIQKHLVEIEGAIFPPKQVFATVTGRARTSFTTMEAQRVLRRLGFVCREAGHRDEARPAWVPVDDTEARPTVVGEGRIAAVETTIATLEAAVAGLHTRVKQLEATR